MLWFQMINYQFLDIGRQIWNIDVTLVYCRFSLFTTRYYWYFLMLLGGVLAYLVNIVEKTDNIFITFTSLSC